MCRWPKFDIEGYFKDEAPGPIELTRAPLLENWRVNLVCKRVEAPSYIFLKNCMSPAVHVIGHPELADHEQIETVILAWLDRSGQWARAKDRLYRLGHRAVLSCGSEALAT